MKTASYVIAAVLAAGLASAASAQDAQIPSWANASPANPVATDGSSLLPASRRADASAYVSLYERGMRTNVPVVHAAPARVIHVWGSTFDAR